MDLVPSEPLRLPEGFWAELFSNSPSSDSLRQAVRYHLEAHSSGRPVFTMVFILDFFARNPEVAENFKQEIVSLLRDSNNSLFQQGAFSVIVACRWTSEIPRLLELPHNSDRFFGACDALIELLQMKECSAERTAFVDRLVAVLSETGDPDDAWALWDKLLDALEKGVAPITAIFAVVGLPLVHAEIRLSAINRVLWPEYQAEVEQVAPELLARLGDMLKDRSLRWSRPVSAGVADLLVIIANSESSDARTDALEALIALSTRNTGAKQRLKRFARSAAMSWYGQPQLRSTWWHQVSARLRRRLDDCTW